VISLISVGRLQSDCHLAFSRFLSDDQPKSLNGQMADAILETLMNNQQRPCKARGLQFDRFGRDDLGARASGPQYRRLSSAREGEKSFGHRAVEWFHAVARSIDPDAGWAN